MKTPSQQSEQQLLENYPVVHREKRHFLQKIAKVFSIITLIVAFVSAGYLFTLNDETEKALKAGVGAIAFFCFTIGLVLHAIASASLPNLQINSKSSESTAKTK